MTITIICPSPLVKDNDIKSIADDYMLAVTQTKLSLKKKYKKQENR